MNCDEIHDEALTRLYNIIGELEYYEDDNEETLRILKDLITEVKKARLIALDRDNRYDNWCSDGDYIAKVETIDRYINDLSDDNNDGSSSSTSRPISPRWSPSSDSMMIQRTPALERWMLSRSGSNSSTPSTPERIPSVNSRNRGGGKNKYKMRKKTKKNSKKAKKSRRQKRSRKTKTRKR